MLNNLYDNIGGKIKNLAKWIFVVEAISAIITGFVLMFTDKDLIVYGLITLVCGPIIAWVGSWILYAFGELVEKTCSNEANTSMIAKLLKEKDDKTINRINFPTYNASAEQKEKHTTDNCEKNVDNGSKSAEKVATEKDTIICSLCNFEQPANQKVCWHCGAKFEKTTDIITSHKWLCHNCKKMRTQSPCEHCGAK